MTTAKTKRDPEGTRRRILLAAVDAFASAGLSGARVDQIAQQAKTNERMLYYYFGSKEQLFVAVLEYSYSLLLDAERELDLKGAGPVETITGLAHFLWDFFAANPGFVRLMNNENLHEARYLRQSNQVRESISPILTALADALKRGQDQGVFRTDVDLIRVYLTICGFGYYIVSNRYSLSAMLGRDFMADDERQAMVAVHTEMLLDYLKKH